MGALKLRNDQGVMMRGEVNKFLNPVLKNFFMKVPCQQKDCSVVQTIQKANKH